MKVLITGANGQLGKEFINILGNEVDVYPLSHKDLDITNVNLVRKKIRDISPDYILHCAAFTSVDKCEFEVNKAFKVNALGTFHVALAASEVNAKLVYFSTDYVFDGKKNSPYMEEDVTIPICIYGKSKLLGEQIVKSLLPQHYIVRTSWLYGKGGGNFVKTMLSLAKKEKQIKVVNDQIGSPTYTRDLVEVALQLPGKRYGVYHVTNTGTCSWYHFAKTIFSKAGYDPNLVLPTTSKEFGAKAERPAYSVLALNALENEGIEFPRHWENAVSEFISEVENND